MPSVNQRGRVLLVLGCLIALAIAAPYIGPFLLILLMQALIFGILAMSLDVLLGFTGLASLGQAAYLGVGAYVTAIFATRYNIGLGWDFIAVLGIGTVAAGLTAALFGLIAIRATGVYFLMITLALGMCTWGLAYRWNSLTGGDNGLNVLFRPVVGLDLADDLTFFYVVWGFFVLTLSVLYLLVQSPFGRSLEGIRESEPRMRMLGYHTWLHKYLAFVIAGGFGGLSGVLWVHLAGIISPEDIILTTSVDALLMVVLGGPGTLIGGAIGAVVVVFIREYLSTQIGWWQYILGVVYIATILYLPDGLMGIPARLRQRRQPTETEAVPEVASSASS
ncbi:branched-chain amino acid ABC transporter permease [Candidatus Entotheonella palauensis]|nr:branched-chain amino acid ABC transporter permease [Candidatus Entotheonella palauensis]